jgi:hypothetical protein
MMDRLKMCARKLSSISIGTKLIYQKGIASYRIVIVLFLHLKSKTIVGFEPIPLAR